MIIPTFQSVPLTDKDGNLTDQMRLYNDELNNVLRNGLSDNGWTLPTVTKAQLTQIVAMTGASAMPNGTMWYVSDSASSTYEMVVLINGALQKVTTTSYP